MVENLIGSIHYNNMNLKIARPFMTNAILHVRTHRKLSIVVELQYIFGRISDNHCPCAARCSHTEGTADRMGDGERVRGVTAGRGR